MIIEGSRLVVADNSGAREVACIRILKSKGCAGIGDVIVISVKKAVPHAKVAAGSVYRGVIVRVRKKTTGKVGGLRSSFSDNAIVLLNKQGDMIGSRIFGPVGADLRDRGFLRVISLASEVL